MLGRVDEGLGEGVVDVAEEDHAQRAVGSERRLLPFEKSLGHEVGIVALIRGGEGLEVLQEELRVAVAALPSCLEVGRAVVLALLPDILDELLGRAAAHEASYLLGVGVEDDECGVGLHLKLLGEGCAIGALHVDLEADIVGIHECPYLRLGEHLAVHLLAWAAPLGEAVEEDEFAFGLGLDRCLFEGGALGFEVHALSADCYHSGEGEDGCC